jgi:3-isopropylmalate/(R)-2-methylmalate dehydratase small subunit
LAVVLQESEIQALFEEVEGNQGCLLTVDLPRQNVTTPEGKNFSFEIDTFSKNCLLKGLDDISWTLQFEKKIQSYEQQAKSEKPWLFISR